MLAATADIPQVKRSWSLQRRVVAYVQRLAGLKGDDVDGLWGDQTEQAYTELVHRRLFGTPEPTWRPEDRVEVNPNNWPSQRTDAELIAHYGPVNTDQRRITLPYPHRIAWDPAKAINSFSCHRKVHDSMLRVLTKVFDVYGIGEIQRLRLDMWGGCLNVRPIRGGTRMSTHSWGIAVDYDPENNQLKWGADRATFARPEYERWWQCWEEEGWVSLGRTRNFDWMHVQAAKL
jgi:hypothetical protein